MVASLERVVSKSSREGGSDFSQLLPMEILASVAEVFREATSTTLKVGATATAITATGAGVVTSSPTLVAAGAVGVTALAVNETMEAEREVGIERTKLETAHGGVDYQKYLENSPASATMASSVETDVKDPFEAFRLCMNNAGLESVTSTTSRDINLDYSCLSQSQARQRARDDFGSR